MSRIVNEAKTFDHKGALIWRSCAEHRATWLAMIWEEAKKQGIDPGPFCRAAIARCGLVQGAGWKEKTPQPDNVGSFIDTMFSEIAVKSFELEVKSKTPDSAELEFHYCPLLKAWQKLGYTDEELAELCDIAMEGDRHIAQAMGYTLDLYGTIAEGCPTCRLHFHK